MVLRAVRILTMKKAPSVKAPLCQELTSVRFDRPSAGDMIVMLVQEEKAAVRDDQVSSLLMLLPIGQG